MFSQKIIYSFINQLIEQHKASKHTRTRTRTTRSIIFQDGANSAKPLLLADPGMFYCEVLLLSVGDYYTTILYYIILALVYAYSVLLMLIACERRRDGAVVLWKYQQDFSEREDEVGSPCCLLGGTKEFVVFACTVWYGTPFSCFSHGI